MKKKLFFLVMVFFSATAASSQTTVPGFRVVTHQIEGQTFSQTFLLESLATWGYDLNTRELVIKKVSQEEIRVRNIAKIEYPELRLTPPQDYLVVHVGSGRVNYAVFCLDAGFEMTWKGTLDIKDSYQSQSIGTNDNIGFKIEQRTHGYVNPSVSSAVKKTFFLVVEEKNSPTSSFSSSYKCVVEGDNLVFLGNSVIKIAKNNVSSLRTRDAPTGTYYW
ncbi:MAG: hypothetical protein LBJ23_06100 [Tannerella sp.]|jgi:hypothetical protein|nr:hypothetical protein [Tannerella sp.]